jgi:DNA invertase Pin-like site-specific DNA recombinase
MRLLLAARLSTLQKDGRDGIGIETQDRRGREWAERQGHEVIDVAADTRSGTVAPWDRPNLAPWVTDAALMARYDGILAYKNDRLSRGVWADEARIRLWAEENRKTLVIVDGPQWPPRHDGDSWAWEAMAKQARKEWEDGRERSIRALNELIERGKLAGRPPWGYTSEGEEYDRRAVPTDDGRAYVPQIFSRVIAGDSLATVAAWLDSEGVAPAGGVTWWAKSVGEICRCPTYAGRREQWKIELDDAGETYRGALVIHRCEPLIDAATFARANKALDGRQRERRGPPVAGALLGAGVLACPRCMWSVRDHLPCSPMYRVAPPGRTPMYRCAGRGSQRTGCGNLVATEHADAAVNRFLSTLEAEIQETRLIPGHDHRAEIADVEMELRSLAAAGLDEDAEDARRAELRAERKRLTALPYVPDRVVTVGTGQTYGAAWSALDASERAAWLRSHNIRIYAARTKSSACEDVWDTLNVASMGAAVLLESGDVSVIVTWLGAGITID